MLANGLGTVVFPLLNFLGRLQNTKPSATKGGINITDTYHSLLHFLQLPFIHPTDIFQVPGTSHMVLGPYRKPGSVGMVMPFMRSF